MFGNEEKNLQYLAQIPESDSYTVEPKQDNTDITLYGENSFVAVNGQNIERITTSENTTEVEGIRQIIVFPFRRKKTITICTR